ncbi:MAG: hypothetical protein IKZ82_12355 [Clostridia bacterium]|nr:hypothetical protein [Clostridia bacterium]
MTDNIEKLIKERADAFVPPMSEGYADMIGSTVSKLREKVAERETTVKSARSFVKPLLAAAAAVVMLFAAAAAVFFARPALAAEIPGVNKLVYAAAPQKEASEADSERIEKLIEEAFHSLIFADYDSARRCFRDGYMTQRENYLAALYLYAAFNDYGDFSEDVRPEVGEAAQLELGELQAEQKAFSFTVRFTLNIMSVHAQWGGGEEADMIGSPECVVSVWENKDGMFIERIEILAEDYQYLIEDGRRPLTDNIPSTEEGFALVPIDEAIFDYIWFYSEYFGVNYRIDRLKRIIAELEASPAAPEDKSARLNILQTALEKAERAIVTDHLPYEEIAEELMYRFYLGGVSGEMSDFSDILEHNEATDLFLVEAYHNAELTALGLLTRYDSVKVIVQLNEMLEETDEFIKAKFGYNYELPYRFEFDENNEEIIVESGSWSTTLTIRKGESGLIIVAVEPTYAKDLYFTMIKPTAEKYKAQGYSWQEAGRMVAEELHERNLRSLEWLENEAKKTPEERARESAASLAGELMYQYWHSSRGITDSAVNEFTERTEQTDLFLWDTLLAAESALLGVRELQFDTVERGTGEIVEIFEQAGEMIKALIHTCVDVKGDGIKRIEQDIILTVRLSDSEYRIISFENPSEDCVFLKELEQIAEGYKNQGYSWEAAGRMAYEEIHERLVREASPANGG